MYLGVYLYGSVIVGSNFNIGSKTSFIVLCECTSGSVKPDSWEIAWFSYAWLVSWTWASSFACLLSLYHKCKPDISVLFWKALGSFCFRSVIPLNWILQKVFSLVSFILFRPVYLFMYIIILQSVITNTLLQVIQEMHFSVWNMDLRSESCELLVLKVWWMPKCMWET